MHQTKRGDQWYCGMKIHAGADKGSGLIHSVVVTAANIHDLTPAADLLHGDEQVGYVNAGYHDIAKRPDPLARPLNSEWRYAPAGAVH